MIPQAPRQLLPFWAPPQDPGLSSFLSLLFGPPRQDPHSDSHPPLPRLAVCALASPIQGLSVSACIN